MSSAVKVPLDAITDRLRESEDADYCAAVIERLKAAESKSSKHVMTFKIPL